MKIEITQAPLIQKFVETMRLANVYLNHFPKHELTALDIAHAKDTASLAHMGRALEIFNRLPEAHKRRIAA